MGRRSGAIYFEFIPVGNYVKVSAVCADTGLEVSIVGSRTASQKELENLARRKLEFVRKKRDESGGASGGGLLA